MYKIFAVLYLRIRFFSLLTAGKGNGTGVYAEISFLEFYNFFLFILFSFYFFFTFYLPTTFTHTHTHDPRHLATLVCFSHIDKSVPVVNDLNGIAKGAVACEQALLGPSPERPRRACSQAKGAEARLSCCLRNVEFSGDSDLHILIVARLQNSRFFSQNQ